MSITNGYGNFGVRPTTPLFTAGAEAKTASTAPSLEGSLEDTFALLGITDFDESDADLTLSAEDLTELNRLLGEDTSSKIDPELDALLGEGPAHTPTSTTSESDISSARLASSFLVLDALAEQEIRTKQEAGRSTLDKVKDTAQSVAAKVKGFFQSKPAQAGKALIEAGMSGVSGSNSLAKEFSSGFITAGSTASVALPGIGAALGLAEAAFLNQKIKALDNKLINLEYILQHDIPNIPINKADSQVVADLEKLKDAAKYAISQLNSRRVMLTILLAGTVVSTTGAAVVMCSGATGVGAAVGAGIGVVGATAKQLPLLKRMARYAYKKATDTLGTERSVQAEALISSARHWHPSISSCADNMLIQLGATKNFHAAGLSAHHAQVGGDLMNELQHKQIKEIVERKLRSSP